MPSVTFAQNLELDNDKIKYVREFPVFEVLQAKAKKEKKSHYNTFNLLPNEDYGDYEAQLYYHKALCWMLAENDYKKFDDLYNNFPEGEIWEMIGIMNAVNYIP
jgi:hypothetical protein